MGILNRAAGKVLLRWMPAMLLIATALSTAVLSTAMPRAAQAQVPFSLAEIRQIQKVRDMRQGGGPAELASAAQSYLKRFPDGRYGDEALLSLGEAKMRQEKPQEALAAYGRLIKRFPQSPFREEAMAGSIQLLGRQGEVEQAEVMSEGLLKRYPRSIYRGRILFWQAQTRFQNEDYAQSLAILEQIQPRSLTPGEQTHYYRMAGWSYRKTDRLDKSWPMFAQYVKRDDTAARKAPVLMMMGEALAKGGRAAEALAHYDQVVERYPDPEHLPEAQFRRAQLFQSTKLKSAAPSSAEPSSIESADADSLRLQAIDYYSAYLLSGDTRYEAQALRGRAPLLKAAGRKEEALQDYQRLVQLGNSTRPEPALLVEIVALLGELGRGSEGAALLTRAIENSAIPQQERNALVVERASLYYRDGDCKNVVAGLEPLPVIREAKQRNRAVFLRGFCRYRLGQWERASWDLEGLVNDPEYVELVWAPLVDAYEKSGQHSRLAGLGGRLLESDQAEPTEELLRSMAAAYEKLGQPDRMLSTIRRLEAVKPEAVRGADIQFRLGRAEEAVGNLDQAETHYLAALAALLNGSESGSEDGGLTPASLGALEQLQSIYLSRGDFAKLAELNDKAAAKAAEKAAPPENVKRIATLQAITYLRWGQAQFDAGEAGQAREKFDLAWAKIPPGVSNQRLEILETVAENYAGKNQHEQARQLYARELKRARGKEEKARISAAFGGFYLAWAEATEKKGPAAGKKDSVVAGRYEKAMALIPPERWRERYRAAVKLDASYQKSNRFKARAQLFERFVPTVPAAGLQDELRVYRARIYKDWAKANVAKGKLKTAEKLLAQGEELLTEAEWQPRYELLGVRGEILIRRKNYSELLIRYEKLLPKIEDPALQSQVNQFVGQIYLTWAQAATDL